MRYLLLVGLVVIVVLLQFVISPRASAHLLYRYTYDSKLAEPGEKIAFSDKLINSWFFPIVYIRLLECMPEGAVILGKNKNKESHSLFLPAHKSYQHTVYFTLPKRGIYRGGKYYLETGDFLGFKSWIESGETTTDITVMPSTCKDEYVLKVLGGYIGDISVRRFIMEDPVLTIGYLDYTGREPMKKISWKHSAKVGKLMVKNSDYTVDANAAIVLNMASGSSKEKEKCLEIVRTVCEKLEEEKISYQFLSNGDAGNLDEGYGKKHFDQIMTNLGRSSLVSFFSFDDLIDCCIRERKRSRSYFIISAPLTPDNRKALIRLQRFSEYELCVLEAEVNQNETD
ncbi:DUF58 domain-containing protein [Butyrivibrio sp. VCB2006]|uniref:DUF58 domain-containing protein n=1 Tax=Butyrivibrio sp. VCB2006 TaxID=1280679 RepID=UPI0004098E9C|nr:DUF58 domain-containing protein [Butyrivibrio sp. VCB2006]